MRIHLIAVVHGCEEPCAKLYGHPGLKIDTRVNDGSVPFTVGVHFQEFVHVISRPALDALFTSLNTARDFLDYLTRKQLTLSQKSFLIDGEEAFVGAYMQSQRGNRPYEIPLDKFPLTQDTFHVSKGYWLEYTNSSLRQTRIEAQEPSFVVDRLIEHMADEYENNALTTGQQLTLQEHAAAFRLLAAESRLGRQLISAALYQILAEDPGTFWSNVVESFDVPGLIYVWMTYPEIPSETSDDEFEDVLQNYLSLHMLVAQRKFRGAKLIFGIALPNPESNRTSRAFLVSDGSIWTKEMEMLAEVAEVEKGILRNVQATTCFSMR